MIITDPHQLQPGDHAIANIGGPRYELKAITFPWCSDPNDPQSAGFRVYRPSVHQWDDVSGDGLFGPRDYTYERRPRFEDLAVGMVLEVRDIGTHPFGLANGLYHVTGHEGDIVVLDDHPSERGPLGIYREWWENWPDNISLHTEESMIHTPTEHEALIAERDQLRADYETFAKAMHEKADEKGLCGEYDDVVNKINETLVNKVPRRSRTVTYDVTARFVLDRDNEPDIWTLLNGLSAHDGVQSVDVRSGPTTQLS